MIKDRTIVSTAVRFAAWLCHVLAEYLRSQGSSSCRSLFRGCAGEAAHKALFRFLPGVC